MKRDRLGRFLSPGAAGQRGGSGGGGGGRTRGRPARSGPSVDEAAALVAARLGWGLARARGDPGEDGADEAGGSGRGAGWRAEPGVPRRPWAAPPTGRPRGRGLRAEGGPPGCCFAGRLTPWCPLPVVKSRRWRGCSRTGPAPSAGVPSRLGESRTGWVPGRCYCARAPGLGGGALCARRLAAPLGHGGWGQRVHEAGRPREESSVRVEVLRGISLRRGISWGVQRVDGWPFPCVVPGSPRGVR